MTLSYAQPLVDYSGARPAPATVRNDGGRAIIRYSAGAGNTHPDTQWKLCEPGEIQAALAAELDFIANSEWYETRVTEGAPAGAVDGAADLAFWRSRGLHRGASIYVSWDKYPDPALWPQVDAYLRAYNDALGDYYHADCYAGTPYLKHALSLKLIRYGWRPNAGSWSNDGIPYQPSVGNALGRIFMAGYAKLRTPAHIWQTGNYWYGTQADENLILRTPVGSHLDASSQIAPVQEDDDMKFDLVQDADGPAVYAVGAGMFVHVNDPSWLKVYQSLPQCADPTPRKLNRAQMAALRALALSGNAAPLDAAVLAAAIVAHLPSSGGLTAAQIQAACEAAIEATVHIGATP